MSREGFSKLRLDEELYGGTQEPKSKSGKRKKRVARTTEGGWGFALAIIGLLAALGFVGFILALVHIGGGDNHHDELHYHEDTENGARVMRPDNQLRFDEAVIGFDGRPSNSYWRGFNATGTDELCFDFSAFGGERVCELVNGSKEPHGGIDVVSWKAGPNGLGIPAHEHQCADEMWQIVNGSCTFWSNLAIYESYAEYPSYPPLDDSDFVDGVTGLVWYNKTTVRGPGIMYYPRGTQFTWTCEPNTFLWTHFSPGGNGGIIRAFATQLFPQTHPNRYPQTQETIRQIESNFCTRFVQGALDRAGIPTGFNSTPVTWPWDTAENWNYHYD